jgi:hypothetical protein
MSDKQMSDYNTGRKSGFLIGMGFTLIALSFGAQPLWDHGYKTAKEDFVKGIENLSLDKIEIQQLGLCAIERLDQIIAESEAN